MSKFRLRGKRRKNHENSENSIPLRSMVPNLITSMAACGGITAIAISATNYAKTLANQPVGDRDWLLALVALLVACLCDAMDGRVARLLKCSSKLGAELDSLADFVNFGVAPAMFLYFWVLSGNLTLSLPSKQMLLAFALFYSMCDAFRLARFNTMLEQPSIPYWKHFFLGVPAPGGCWMVVTPVVLALSIPEVAGVLSLSEQCLANLRTAFQHPYLAMFMLFLVGALMASRLPTISLKSIHLTKKYMLPSMAMLILLVAFLFTHFWLTLGVLGALYLLTVPVVCMIFLGIRAKYLREQGPVPQNTEPRQEA